MNSEGCAYVFKSMPSRACTGPSTNMRQAKVVRHWREYGVKRSTIAVYLRWVQRFEDECRRQGVAVESQLTSRRVAQFAQRYARSRGLDAHGTHAAARGALHSWACALAELGDDLPVWVDPTPSRPDPSRLTREFVQFQVWSRCTHCRPEFKRFWRHLHWGI